MNSWKRRWCVLKDETFLWFRSKQEALKQGWLHKKGGGSSTLSRRNWKKRWFVLRQSKLMYFENDSEEKLKGTVEVRTAKYVPTAQLLEYADECTYVYMEARYQCRVPFLRGRLLEIVCHWSLGLAK